MANLYEDILKITANGKNQMGLSNTIKRDYGIPLDFTSVQENYQKAVEYAATSTLAYVGQPISVGDKLYIITETSQGKYPAEVAEGESQLDVFLAEVGSATEGDGKTIKLENGVLSLFGIDDKLNGTYVPTLIDGVLTWDVPDTTTVEGLSVAIEDLDRRADSIELVLGKEADEENEATGLIKAVADNNAAILTEASTRSEAIKAINDSIGTVAEGKTVVKLIEEAEASAKAAIPVNVSAFTNDAGYLTTHQDISGKADRSTTLAGYGILDAYTKDQVNEAISSITHFTSKVVTSTTEMTETNVLYLIKSKDFEGKDNYDEYLLIEGIPTRIGDTSTDLTDYVTNNALATELARYTTTAGLVDVLAPYAKTEIVNADLNKKVDKETYNTDKATLEQSITDGLAGKVDNATLGSYYTKTEIDNKGYAVAETVNAALDTKANKSDIEATLSNIYTKEEVNAIQSTLNSAIELKANASEVYNKTELDELLAEVNNSISDISADLTNHTSTAENRFNSIEAVIGNAKTDEADASGLYALIETAQTTADDANTAIANLIDGQIKTNTDAVAELTTKVAGIETQVNTNKDNISAIDTQITNINTTLESNATKFNEVEAELSTLDLAIKANSAEIEKKANTADVYTKAEVDTKVKEAIEAIPPVDLTDYATTEFVNAEVAKKANIGDSYTKAEADDIFMTESEVDAHINTLINAADPEGGKVISDIANLVKYVEENAGDIAELITATDNNTAKLADITGTVGATIDSKIEAAKYTLEAATSEKLGGIKTSDADNGITVDETGVATVAKVNINTLVQTEGDVFILNGGTSSN